MYETLYVHPTIQYVRPKPSSSRPHRVGPRGDAALTRCPACGVPLRGLEHAVRCPACGVPFSGPPEEPPPCTDSTEHPVTDCPSCREPLRAGIEEAPYCPNRCRVNLPTGQELRRAWKANERCYGCGDERDYNRKTCRTCRAVECRRKRVQRAVKKALAEGGTT